MQTKSRSFRRDAEYDLDEVLQTIRAENAVQAERRRVALDHARKNPDELPFLLAGEVTAGDEVSQ